MSKVKIELNASGLEEMLASPYVQGVCKDYAQRTLSAAQVSDPGYTMKKSALARRGMLLAKEGYSIVPGDVSSYYDNLKNNTLEKTRGLL